MVVELAACALGPPLLGPRKNGCHRRCFAAHLLWRRSDHVWWRQRRLTRRRNVAGFSSLLPFLFPSTLPLVFRFLPVPFLFFSTSTVFSHTHSCAPLAALPSYVTSPSAVLLAALFLVCTSSIAHTQASAKLDTVPSWVRCEHACWYVSFVSLFLVSVTGLNGCEWRG